MMDEVEVYQVRRSMHLGPIRRDIRSGSVITWDARSATMTLDGMHMSMQNGVDTQEAMRMLFALRDRNPDDPPIAPCNAVQEERLSHMPMRTVVSYLWNWYAALSAVERRLGISHEDAGWEPVNERQRDYLEIFGRREIRKYESMFTIQINEEANMLHVHAAMRFKPMWRYRPVPGMSSDAGFIILEHGMVCASEPKVHPYPVVSVLAQSDVRVGFASVDRFPDMADDQLSLFKATADVANVRRVTGEYRQVRVPKVALNHSAELEWAKGLRLQEKTIGSLVCSVNFEYDEDGQQAGLNEGINYATTGSLYDMLSPDLPFLLWMDDGSELPIFQALICRDAWSHDTV